MIASSITYLSACICLIRLIFTSPTNLNNTYVVGSGYDPTIGKAFQSYTDRDRGIKLQLFLYNITKSTISLDNQLLMPEKTDWRRELKCSGDMEHEIIDSYEKYLNSRTRRIKVGVRGSFCVGFWLLKKCFSYDVGFSRDSYKYKRHIENFKSVYYHFYYKCIFYWGGLLPDEYPDLHPGFAKALANLPEKFDKNNPDPFYSLFEDYGTHYIHHVTLGAQLGQVFQLSQASSDILSKTYRRDSSWAKLGPFYSSHSNEEMSEIEKFFYKYTRSRSIYVGGGKLPQSGSPLQWMANVGENPVPVDFEIKPISQLLFLVEDRKLSKDFKNYESRLSALQQATASYFQSKSVIAQEQAQKQNFQLEIKDRDQTLDSTLGACSFCTSCGGEFPQVGGYANYSGNDLFGLGAKCSNANVHKQDYLSLCCTKPSIKQRGFCRFISIESTDDQTAQNQRLSVTGKLRVLKPWVYPPTGLGLIRVYYGTHDIGLACSHKMCALCSTCGGQYSYFYGALWEQQTVTTYGNQCKGELQPRVTDAKLCCRNGLDDSTQEYLQNGLL